MEPEPRPPPERRGAVLRRYLAARSPLDMGPAEASVQADGRVRYLPSAALVVRRAALGAGFDEALRHGEDVDLLWRLRDAGWRIRYDPSAIVEHHEPRTLGAVLARRFRYGTSAGPLARRHPRGLAPARIEPRRALIALLLVRGRPGPAGVVGLIELGSLLRRTRGLGVPSRWTARWIAESTGQTILSLARYLAGFALPIVLAAAWRARDPRPVLFVCLPALQEWALRETELDPVRWTALALADEVAYGAGVVVGSIRSRTIRPLIPRFG
jgi:hypothetical protein